MGVKYVNDFEFPASFGFHGSVQRRATGGKIAPMGDDPKLASARKKMETTPLKAKGEPVSRRAEVYGPHGEPETYILRDDGFEPADTATQKSAGDMVDMTPKPKPKMAKGGALGMSDDEASAQDMLRRRGFNETEARDYATQPIARLRGPKAKARFNKQVLDEDTAFDNEVSDRAKTNARQHYGSASDPSDMGRASARARHGLQATVDEDNAGGERHGDFASPVKPQRMASGGPVNTGMGQQSDNTPPRGYGGGGRIKPVEVTPQVNAPRKFMMKMSKITTHVDRTGRAGKAAPGPMPEASDSAGKPGMSQFDDSDNGYAKGGRFIQSAIKHPGALHRDLGVPQGQKIPAAKMAAAAKRPGKVGQRARFAETLKGLRK